jgi:predicted HicB family RNase H-like nuclease
MKASSVLHYKGYSAKPEYSAADRLFYGKILGIDDLVDFSSENARDLEGAFHSAVDDYLAFCEEIGKNPQREYSGMFHVRISPELHRKISMIAQAEGVSLNKAAEQAIAALTQG